MDLGFSVELAESYRASSQKIRVLSETWVHEQVYCPGCGNDSIERYHNNCPAADFFCANCGEDFELKSKRGSMGRRIVDGAYATMIARITSDRNPNFFLLGYDSARRSVTDLVIIPKHFFVPTVIERRNPLSELARRAGWVGCNIRLDEIPQSGRIALVANGAVLPKATVLQTWHRTLFLRNAPSIDGKGWLLAVMGVIDRIGRNTFSLNELYDFEAFLGTCYPGNRHIRAKIRQQLQILRDRGYLGFDGEGTYTLTTSAN